MKTRLSFAAFLLATSACTAPQQEASAPAPAAPPPVAANEAVDPEAEDRRLVEFLDRAFEESIASSPETQTALGRKTNYGKLDDYTDARAERQR